MYEIPNRASDAGPEDREPETPKTWWEVLHEVSEACSFAREQSLTTPEARSAILMWIRAAEASLEEARDLVEAWNQDAQRNAIAGAPI